MERDRGVRGTNDEGDSEDAGVTDGDSGDEVILVVELVAEMGKENVEVLLEGVGSGVVGDLGLTPREKLVIVVVVAVMILVGGDLGGGRRRCEWRRVDEASFYSGVSEST